MLSRASLLSAALIACAAGVATVSAQDAVRPRTGQDVIRAMHAKYAGSWYPTVTFVQKVVWTDGRPAQDWWEALMIPGRLRIDVGPVEAPPRTIIFRGEMRHDFQDGKLARSERDPNLLLVLGFDVYGQAPDTTARLLEAEGFNLSVVREDTWEGRPVWVVGAAAGDLTSKQFWVEQERLLFLRLVQKNRAGAVSDVRFTKYEPLGKGWLGTVVEFYTDGKETFREVYRDWRINPNVTESLFEVETWRLPAWAIGTAAK